MIYKEFEVAGRTFRCVKLDAFSQFHVSRRLAPLFAGAAEAKGEDLLSRLRGGVQALSAMSDEDANYVLFRCLGVVQVKLDGDRGWQTIYSAGAGRMMDDTIDMMQMLQIVGEVLVDSLGNFTSALPPGLVAAMAAGSTSSPSA
jgi:hypothetical protein